MSSADITAPSADGTSPGRRFALVMGALMLTLLLEALDQTVVGTAMPRIIGTLRGFDRYTWAVSAYVLASTIMLPIAGSLSDCFGRKPFLLGGTALFLAGSALCGAAQTINQLIAFRAVQGLGAGIGISLVFAGLTDIVPEQKRARWQGILGSVYGISSVTGPALGGWLSQHGPLLLGLVTAGARWRWVFYVNLPLGIVALAALALYFPGGERSEGRSFGWRALLDGIDVAGSLLIATTTVCLLIGLTWLGEGSHGWAATKVYVMLGLTVLLALPLIRHERKAHDPVVPVGLFRNHRFAVNAVLTIFLWMALFGTAFYVPLFLQGVLDVSPTTTGLIMTPFSLSIAAGNAVAGVAISRLGGYRPVAVAGALSMAGGVALLAGASSSVLPMEVALSAAIAGAGMGVLFTISAVTVQTALPPRQIGAGFGVTRYLGQIGGAVGLALVGTIVNVSFTAALHREIPVVVTSRLARDGVKIPTGPQAIIGPTFRAKAMEKIAQTATRTLSGQHRKTLTVIAIRQNERLLNRVLIGLRLSLADAIRRGLIAALLFSVGAIVSAFLLDDAMGERR